MTTSTEPRGFQRTVAGINLSADEEMMIGVALAYDFFRFVRSPLDSHNAVGL